jgi:SAM-dependent methyltransferase
MKVLELGCGNKKEYEGSIGFDKDKNSKADVFGDVTEGLPFKDNSMDLVFASHILEHILDLPLVVQDVWRVLKPNGQFVIRVPHYSGRVNTASIQHIRLFGLQTFNKWSIEYPKTPFKVDSVSLHWVSLNYKPKIVKVLVGKILDFVANMYPAFCERIWCYWMGGFEEVEFILQKEVLINVI